MIDYHEISKAIVRASETIKKLEERRRNKYVFDKTTSPIYPLSSVFKPSKIISDLEDKRTSKLTKNNWYESDAHLFYAEKIFNETEAEGFALTLDGEYLNHITFLYRGLKTPNENTISNFLTRHFSKILNVIGNYIAKDDVYKYNDHVLYKKGIFFPTTGLLYKEPDLKNPLNQVSRQDLVALKNHVSHFFRKFKKSAICYEEVIINRQLKAIENNENLHHKDSDKVNRDSV